MTEKQWNHLWGLTQKIEGATSDMQDFFTEAPRVAEFAFISGVVAGLSALNEEVKHLLQTSFEVE